MAKSSRSKSSSSRSDQRRQELLRNLPKPATALRQAMLRPEFIRTACIIFAFLVLLSLLVTRSREMVLVPVGQYVSDTRLTRLDYEIEDVKKTEDDREAARRASPRIYITNDEALDRLEASLMGLPTAVAGESDTTALAGELQEQFQLDDASLAALQDMSAEGEPTAQWIQWVQRLIDTELSQAPLLEAQEFQVYSVTPVLSRALLLPDGRLERPLRGEAISMEELGGDEPPTRLIQAVSSAGFPDTLVPTITGRITSEQQPTLKLDAATTDQLRGEAAASVAPAMIPHAKGDIIWRRGDQLTPETYQLALQEAEFFTNTGGFASRWLPRAGIVFLLAILAIFMAAYAVSAHDRIARNPMRLVALCFLMVSMMALTVWISAEAPAFLYAAAIAPLLFTVVVVRLAYDRRLAVFLGGIQAAIATMALQEDIGWFILMMAGVGAMIAQVTEVRHRNSLIRASLVTALVLGVGCIVLNMIELPVLIDGWAQVVLQAMQSAAASLGVGFLVLGILPSIEQVFGITTGMTLAELRDPRRPLLQQLQQHAPGTYNHSLQVAHIAEAAADSIGADSLLIYVGALYHDIGKMNKPMYFVENQQPGDNLHDKLSPAMSLLVIIGHVKDGVELAREYNLPREIIHFIESHHGSTLVEYFYHAERQKAEDEGREAVDEIEFRYPGPKPRTREAAILMLSDCVESATRAMADPKPAQIENLVRELARKRLIDGQFDECSLTFRELDAIQTAIIARVTAIYHGRIAYPEDEESTAPDVDDDTTTVEAATAG
ncbi:MAG: HDIG domain-containing protein [Phycisphaerales bacterium]|nr:HDIG domain-containing protein [Phycisphaerales bacterium]